MDATRTFEWDDAKAAANVAKHGLLFSEAAAIWADPEMVDEDASRAMDGEQRGRAIGLIDGVLFVAVYTMRAGVTRIISARRANTGEERRYGNR